MSTSSRRQNMAQHLFELLRDGPFPAALSLLEELDAEGLRLADTEVRVPGDGGERPAPLHAALLDAQSKEEPRSGNGFHTADAVRRLRALTPHAFAGEDGTGSLFWQHLVRWGAREKAHRAKWHWSMGDGWLAEVIGGLPATAFEGQQAADGWRALLSFPCPRAFDVMTVRQPARWMARDSKGQFLLRSAESSEAWAGFLRQGGDPWTPAADGQPMWRALLPKGRQNTPETGSFRAAVELWVRTHAAADPDPARHGYARQFLCTTVVARLGNSEWVKQPLAQRIVLLQSMPVSWLHETMPSRALGLPEGAPPVPAWLVPFFVQTGKDANGWLQALRGVKPWHEAIGPVLDFVGWVLDQRKREDGQWMPLASAPDAVQQGARSEALSVAGPALVALWKTCWERQAAAQWVRASARTPQTLIEHALLERAMPDGTASSRRHRL